MKIKFGRSSWSVSITWSGLDLEPLESSKVGSPGVSGRLRRVVTGWLTSLSS